MVQVPRRTRVHLGRERSTGKDEYQNASRYNICHMQNKTRSDRSPHNPYPQNLLTFLVTTTLMNVSASPKLPKPLSLYFPTYPISFHLSPYISNFATGPGDCVPLASPECLHLPIPPTSASLVWITMLPLNWSCSLKPSPELSFWTTHLSISLL